MQAEYNVEVSSKGFIYRNHLKIHYGLHRCEDMDAPNWLPNRQDLRKHRVAYAGPKLNVHI